MRKIYIFAVFFLCLSAVFFMFTGVVNAATIYVNYSTGNDTAGDGSSGTPYKTFHKGYTIASSGDTLNLTGTFTWTNADETGDAATTGYTISKNLTIQGQSAATTIIQAAGSEGTADRAVINISAANTVTINDITVRYGRNTGGTSGGGINNGGILTVNRCTVSNNYVSQSGSGYGGGIRNAGTLTVNDSTVNNNYAYSQGGGIVNAYTAAGDNVLYVTNSTIAFNSTSATVATVGGAGIFLRSGTAYVTNATIAYNYAPDGTGDTTGIDIESATLYIKNSIVAGNKVTVGGTNYNVNYASGNFFDVYNWGTVYDNGGNIFGKISGVTLSATTWYDVNSNSAGDNVFTLNNTSTTGSLFLDTNLQTNSNANGVKTLAITKNTSVAVNNGLATANGSVSIPAADQRAVARSGSTDIGSYEYDGTYQADTPTTQAYNISFSNVQHSRMTISWTSGDGASRAVFVKQANSGTAAPVDSTTYTANTAFGSGTQIGTSGWYCVYNNTGASVDITGLSAGTDYIVQVFEYNGTYPGVENYLTDTGTNNPKSQATHTPVTIYANYSTGNDTTGSGTSGAPYKTFNKAYTVALGGDTINLTGTFTWSNTDETGDAATTGFTIAKDITIQGQSASQTIIQASSTANTALSGVFTISSGYTVIINDVTIRYGYKTGASSGGGIYNQGTLTVNRCSINNNYVNQSGSGYGGGISNIGTLTVNYSTIDNNYAYSQGGGLVNSYLAANTNVIYLTNSTVVFNSTAANLATVGGAGYFQRSGTAYVTNTTIAYNDATNQNADGSSTGDTSGIQVESGTTLYIKNSIVAYNEMNGGNVTNVSGNCFDITNSGTLTDNGGNIFGKVNTAYSGLSFAATSWYDRYGNSTGDSIFTLYNTATTGSLNLDTALNDNGTTLGTQTLAITAADSIAVNNGLATANGSVSIPATDQRGANRSGGTDIGPYEYGGISDITAPTISLTLPTASEATSSAMTLVASASDNVAVSGVKFYIDGVLQGSEDTSSPYTIAYDTTATTTGSHFAFAVARDSSNNYATSTSVAFTVVDNAPTVSLALPTTGSATSSTMTLAASASDDRTLAGVKFYINNTLIGAEDTASPYLITYNTTATSTGVYSAFAVARDSSNNYATSTSVSFTIDNDAPTVSLALPTTGSATSSTMTLIASASGGIAIAGVKFYIDGVLQGSEDTSSPYAITYNTVATSTGAHSAFAVARNLSNYYATSTAVSFTIDNTGPTVVLTLPTVGSATSSIMTLAASASDGTAVAGVKFYVDGILQGSEDTSSPYAITYNTVATSTGAHSAFAVARDSLNNYATSTSISFTVDNTGPTVALTLPTALEATSSVMILAASASDGTAVAGVKFYLDGILQGSEDTAAPYSTTYNTTATSSGAHSVFAVARDSLNNYATSTAVSFTVDNSGLTVYVNSSTGNDTAGDGTSGAPYKTFHKGYTAVQANTILDLTGTFTWTDAAETGDATTTGYTINKNLIINGHNPDQTIIQAASYDNTASSRVFTMASGVTATLRNLAIRYGKLTGSGGDGGGIKNSGELTITNCEIYNNRAMGDGGGGVSNRDKLTVNNSTVYNNVANYMGGGLLNNYYVAAAGYLNITNSTIAYNQVTSVIAYTEGGGVHYRKGGGMITNSTIAYNTACGAGGVGMDDPAGYLTLKNNIIAKNLRLNHSYCHNGLAPIDFDFRQSGYGNVTDNGNNIIGYSYYYSWAGANEWLGATSWSGALNWNQSTFTLRGTATTGSLNMDDSLAVNSNSNKTQTLALLASSIASNNGASGSNGSIDIPAADQRGNARSGATDIGAFEYSGAPADVTAPVISAVQATVATTTATITWTTNEEASSQIKYDPNINLSTMTAIYNSSTKTIGHEVALSNLVACTKYYYAVISQDDAGNIGTGDTLSFITAGCAGSSAVTTVSELSFNPASTENTGVDTATGQTASDSDYRLSQTAGNLTFGLTIPRAFAENQTSLQLKSLAAEPAISSLSRPTGYLNVGSNVFDIKALTDPASTVSSFASAVTTTLSYSDSDVAGLDETSLKIYRHDGESWTQLDNCSVDTAANTVSCQTSHFSTFGLFGTALTSTQATSASSGGSGLPPQAYSSPAEPSPLNGSFQIRAGVSYYTEQPDIVLELAAGSDIVSMAVSNFSDFSNAETEPFATRKNWNICWKSNTIREPKDCLSGTHLVYAKFYNVWGQTSAPIYTNVVYDKKNSQAQASVNTSDSQAGNIRGLINAPIKSIGQEIISLKDGWRYAKFLGKVLVKVESRGQAYYLNPKDKKAYFLGSPAEALIIMKARGVNVTDKNINKIPVGLLETSGADSDNDGLSDALEQALGTNLNKKDTDGDGYDDKIEILNNYNPLGPGKLAIAKSFAKAQAGNILIRTKNNGEAWYVSPADNKRYLLSQPADAQNVIKKFGVGITDKNFGNIIKPQKNNAFKK